VQAVEGGYPLWTQPIRKLANPCDSLLFWGHNILCRTKFIQAVGGFADEFISEDYVTALRLWERGYPCRAVDVTSYDMLPETPHSYSRRLVRWAQSILEIIIDERGRKVPFTVRLRLFMTAYSYLIWFVLIAGMVLATWGYRSSWRHLRVFCILLWNGQLFQGPAPPWLVIFSIYLVYFVLIKPILAYSLGVRIPAYMKHIVFGMALSFYAAFPLLVGQFKTITGYRTLFLITHKARKQRSSQ